MELLDQRDQKDLMEYKAPQVMMENQEYKEKMVMQDLQEIWAHVDLMDIKDQ